MESYFKYYDTLENSYNITSDNVDAVFLGPSQHNHMGYERCKN